MGTCSKSLAKLDDVLALSRGGWLRLLQLALGTAAIPGTSYVKTWAGIVYIMIDVRVDLASKLVVKNCVWGMCKADSCIHGSIQ
jgi:hypothetical protein